MQAPKRLFRALLWCAFAGILPANFAWAQWSVPDKGTAQNDIQSIMFHEYLDVLVAGINGVDAVLSGGACTAQGSPDMTVAVSKAGTLSNQVMKATAAANATIGTADATNPRIDLVVINSSGAIATRAGTAAAAPKPPARTANDVVLCAVYVPANDTTISSDQITDLRVLRTNGPIMVYRTTSAETTNTTAGAIEVLNKANSGVTVPNGLFTTGKILRVRIGGDMLWNNTTPTVRVAVLYGGTTMFSDISGATTNDTDRASFVIEFDLVAVSTTSQSVTGHMQIAILGAKTAPTTGIGDIWSTASQANSFAGTAAVDSGAANQLLSVQVTLSVSNVANEVTVKSATVELL